MSTVGVKAEYIEIRREGLMTEGKIKDEERGEGGGGEVEVCKDRNGEGRVMVKTI